MKNFTRRSMLGFVCAFALSSCGAAPQEEYVAKSFTVNSVQLTVVEGAARGRFEDKEARNAALASLKSELETSLAEIPGGDVPATALISISSMRLKAAGARLFGASNEIEATVQIVDSNGNPLQPNGTVGYWDQAKNTEVSVNNNPLIGVLINAGRNAAHSQSGQDVGQLLSGFSDAMVDWLKS